MSDGFSLSSFPWRNNGAAGGRVTITDRAGNGFQIIADPRERGLYPLLINGYGKFGRGNQQLFVVSPQWHYCEFAKLEAITLEGGPFLGQWFTNISSDPHALVYPVSSPLVPGDLPSAIGGTFPAANITNIASFNEQIAEVFNEIQALTRAAPFLPNEGQLINSASVFGATVRTNIGGVFITGGTVDIWRFQNLDTPFAPNFQWVMVAQGISLPTGVETVGIAFDQFLLRGGGGADRWLVATNNVTRSDANVTVMVTQRIA